MNQRKEYNERFYDKHYEGMKSSSMIVLDLVKQFYEPESIVDVGCGQGAWLESAKSIWKAETTGFDGHWVDKSVIAERNVNFIPVDLEREMESITGKYDLCISLEVAEHLPVDCADRFVETLSRLSDVVLFSAAIPKQGGAGHQNEKWQSYWANKFIARGFTPVDILRKQIWGNKNVEWWYRQNVLLYIKSNHPILRTGIVRELIAKYRNSIMDIVHPNNYIRK